MKTINVEKLDAALAEKQAQARDASEIRAEIMRLEGHQAHAWETDNNHDYELLGRKIEKLEKELAELESA
jgi:hypothetical protein